MKPRPEAERIRDLPKTSNGFNIAAPVAQSLENLRFVPVPQDETFPEHVVLADGTTILELSLILATAADAADETLADGTWAKYLGASLRVFDWWYAAARLSEGFDPFRSGKPQVRLAFKAWLKKMRCTYAEGPKNSGYIKVTAPVSCRDQVRTAAHGLRKAYDVLILADAYAFENPFKIDEQADRERRRRLHMAKGGKGGEKPKANESDYSDAWLRFDGVPCTPPRKAVTDIVANVVELMIQLGHPQAIILATRFARETGCRISEALFLPVAGLVKTEALGTQAVCTNKASRGRAVKKTIFTQTLGVDMFDFVDQCILARDPDGNGIADAIADCKAERTDKWERVPVFPNFYDGFYSDSGYEYWWHPVADLIADDPVTGERIGVRPTPHFLRHAFVNDYLAAIPADWPRGKQARAREILVKYMAWRTGERMLEVYGAEQAEAEVAMIMGASIEKRMAAMERLIDGVEIPAAAIAKSERMVARNVFSKMFDEDDE